MSQDLSHNKMTEMLCDELVPFACIVAYKNSKGNYYLETRTIDEYGRMGAGKPLTDKFISSIIKTLSVTTKEIDTSIRGVMPSNVLYCDTRIDNEKLVWYRPREKRCLFFTQNSGMPNGVLEVPAMLYCAERTKGLTVHCFKGSKPKGKLYKAPFFNTSDDHVCLGSAKLNYPEDRTFENVMKYWEDMYWKSEFAHILGDNPVTGNLATITKNCIENGLPFPEDQLIESKHRLEEYLK